MELSVTDAHVASLVGASTERVAVITSDVDDLRRIAGHLGVNATVIHL